MDRKYYINNSNEIPSPALMVYSDLMEKNIQAALNIAKDPSKLRPHVKTHKTREIVQIEMKYNIRKHKCATLAEAEMLAESGITDILIAYQLVGPNIQRLVSLKERFPECDFKVLIDNSLAAEWLSEAMKSNKMEVGVLIDLNVGMDRTGIAPDERAIQLYERLLLLPGIKPCGLHAYDGHNHESDLVEREKEAKKTIDMVFSLKDMLWKKGVEVSTTVMGGTPTFPIYAKLDGIETSPGTFVLHDFGYQTLFPDMDYFTPAALLLSRIISLPTSESITLDLGYKAISADPSSDRGKVLNIEAAQVYNQNEEHWVVKTPNAKELRVGAEVYVCPTHICPTVALHKYLYVIDSNGYCVDRWQVTARDRDISTN